MSTGVVVATPGAGPVLQLAANLASASRRVDLAAHSRESLRAAAELLERQKVSFIPVASRYGDALEPTPLAEFLARDRARYRAQRDEFERIRLAFAAAGVQPMVFKSAGAAPSFHYLSSNLDILVPDGEANVARARLVELGYVELLNIEEPKKFLFRRFPGDGSTFAFHLHEVVGWGVPFLDNAPVWKHARRATDDEAILIPGPSEALLVTLAHWFYEDKALSLGNLLLTAHALSSMDGALAESATHARARGWEEGFWGALCVFDRAWSHLYGEPFLAGEQRAELDRAPARYAAVRSRILPWVRYGEDGVPARLPFLRNKVAYYRKMMRDAHRNPVQKWVDVGDTLLWAVRWKLHIRSQPAMLVTLSGCDGSGKTLQAERVRGVFETCDIRVRPVWARGASSRGASVVLRAGKRVLGRGGSAPPSGEAARFDERQRRMRNPFVRWVFSIVFATDLFWPYVVTTRRAMLSGNVVVCDRHICDALVDFALFTGTDPARPPFALKVLHAMVPRAHVGVILDVDAEEALRRKPEEGGTEHLEAARRMYLALGEARRMRIVPAGPGADEIQARIAREALREFYLRYSTLINWLLRSNPGQVNPRDAAL